MARALLRQVLAVIALAAAACSERPAADPRNAVQVAQGKTVYEAHCAACHGAKLEGQPNWREKLPSGKLPAPPHDASGHTWHHSDQLLFNITRNGIAAYAPPGYQSDMPAYKGQLSDAEIWAVLAYIKNTWPAEILEVQANINRDEKRR